MRFYPLVGLRLEPVENFQTVSEGEFSETRMPRFMRCPALVFGLRYNQYQAQVP